MKTCRNVLHGGTTVSAIKLFHTLVVLHISLTITHLLVLQFCNPLIVLLRQLEAGQGYCSEPAFHEQALVQLHAVYHPLQSHADGL